MAKSWSNIEDIFPSFGKMSNTSAIFIVILIAAGLYFWIFRPKRGN